MSSPTEPFSGKVGLKDNDINHNLNNLDNDLDEQQSRKVSIQVQIQLILLALDVLKNERGSTLRDIRRCLCCAGLIGTNDDLRRAMVVALKRGFVARPPWAVRSKNYGFYIKGDGVAIYAGSKKKKVKRRKSRKARTRARGKNGSSRAGGMSSGSSPVVSRKPRPKRTRVRKRRILARRYGGSSNESR